MNLSLQPDEVRCLSELVEARLNELASEIHHARVPRFKDELKDYRESLERVLERLRPALEDEARPV